MLKIVIVFGVMGSASSALAAAAAPNWRKLADCAAAYRANAEIIDPDRAPSMTASVSDEAAAYAKAATRRLGAPAKRTERTVRARIAKSVPAFRGQSRSTLDQFIDACPQIEP